MVWQPVVRCTAKSGPVNWNQQFDRCVSLKMQLGVDQWHKGEMFQPCSGTSTSRAWSQNEVNFQSHRKIHFSRLFLILVTGPHRYDHGSETCWTRESGRRRRTPMPNARSCNVVEREYKNGEAAFESDVDQLLPWAHAIILYQKKYAEKSGQYFCIILYKADEQRSKLLWNHGLLSTYILLLIKMS